MFVGLWPAAGFFPPHLPSASAEEIAAIYQRDAVGIRLGMIIIMIAGALYMPFTAAITAQMRRIEHRVSPVLTYTQLGAGIATILLFLTPALIWTAAAYRPERSPDVTQALNDLGWFFFVMPFVLAFVQNLALGFTIINDKRPRPVFPRWVGFFNFWIALLFVPGCMVTFFKTGPFAWNGLIAFWVPACVFGPWFFVVSIYVMKAARQQQADGE
jgi:phage shock protein PspC (stress-responsive transcriptional regulator)